MTDVAILRTILDADPSKLEKALAAAEAKLRNFEKLGGQIGSRAGSGLGQGLAQGAQQGAAGLDKLDQAARRAGAAVARQAGAEERAANAALTLARAQARGAQAAGDHARAAEILARALEGSKASALAQQNALNQLEAAQRKAAASADDLAGKTSAAGGGFGELAELAGVAINPVTIVTATIAAAGAAMLSTAENARLVGQSLRELTPAEVQEVTAALQSLSAQFGADIPASIDTTRVLMQAFGASSAEATDILAAGFANGLNSSGDFLDTLKEYSPQFAQLGFSADDALSIIQRGLQAGARDTDFIGDALKEFNILLRETGTIEALAPLDAGLASLVQQFQAGQISGEEAFTAITAAIGQIEDPITQRAAGVALFGTKFEDLGESAVVAMGRVDGALITTAGSLDQVNSRITSLTQLGPLAFNALGESLQPTNSELLQFANALLSAKTNLEAGVAPAQALNDAVLASATSYEDYRAKIDGALEGTNNFIAGSQILQGVFGASAPVVEAFSSALLGLVSSLTDLSEEEVNASIAARDAAAAQVEQEAATLNVAVATDQATAATATNTTASEQNASAGQVVAQTAAEVAAARLLQGAEAQEAAAAEDELRAALGAANAAGADVGPIVAGIVAKYGLEESKVYELIGAYRQLNAARSGVDTKGLANQRAGERGPALDPGRAAEVERLNSQALRFAQQQARQAATRGSGGAGGGGGSGGAPRAVRGGGGGRGGASAADKEAEKAAKAAEREEQRQVSAAEQLTDKLTDLETDRQQKLNAIVEEYAKKRAKAQEGYNTERLQGDYDFYKALGDITDQGVAKQASAEFEAARLEADKLASTKGADVAERYLEEQANIIQARAQRQEEINQALKDGDAAEAEYLKALDEKARKAEEARLAGITSGEDSLASEQAAAEADVNADAAKRQAELLGGAQQLADAETERLRLLAAQTVEYQKQAELAGRVGGGVPAGAGASASGAGGGEALPTTTTAVPISVISPELQAAIVETLTKVGAEIVAAVQSGAVTTAQASSAAASASARAVEKLRQPRAVNEGL
jgi:hypothetical protein